jgi:hypothetical protein
MFKKITLVALAACSAFSVFAQKPDWEKVEAVYTRLPLKPIAPLAKKYTMEVVLDCDNITKEKVANRDALIQSVTTTNALLVKQGKPAQPYPEDGNYYPVERTVQSIKTALKLDGCQEVTSAPEFTVKVKVSGFDFVQTTLKESTLSTTTTTNGTSTKQHWYDISFVYKVSYEIISPSGEVVRDEVLAGTDKVSKVESTKRFNSQWELESWWNSATGKAQKVTYDNDAYKRAMSECNAQLNSELGYTVITTKLNVATMKDAEYADIIAAFGDASMGYNYLSADKAKASDYLLKCVAVWEKAVKEHDPAAKKQRINEDVLGALYANLAVAYCFLEDWAQCNHNMVKLKAMDKGGKLTHKLQEAEEFKKDYEARVKANKVN